MRRGDDCVHGAVILADADTCSNTWISVFRFVKRWTNQVEDGRLEAAAHHPGDRWYGVGVIHRSTCASLRDSAGLGGYGGPHRPLGSAPTASPGTSLEAPPTLVLCKYP